jgi:hypothetical protein
MSVQPNAGLEINEHYPLLDPLPPESYVVLRGRSWVALSGNIDVPWLSKSPAVQSMDLQDVPPSSAWPYSTDDATSSLDRSRSAVLFDPLIPHRAFAPLPSIGRGPTTSWAFDESSLGDSKFNIVTNGPFSSSNSFNFSETTLKHIEVSKQQFGSLAISLLQHFTHDDTGHYANWVFNSVTFSASSYFDLMNQYQQLRQEFLDLIALVTYLYAKDPTASSSLFSVEDRVRLFRYGVGDYRLSRQGAVFILSTESNASELEQTMKFFLRHGVPAAYMWDPWLRRRTGMASLDPFALGLSDRSDIDECLARSVHEFPNYPRPLEDRLGGALQETPAKLELSDQWYNRVEDEFQQWTGSYTSDLLRPLEEVGLPPLPDLHRDRCQLLCSTHADLFLRTLSLFRPQAPIRQLVHVALLDYYPIRLGYCGAAKRMTSGHDPFRTRAFSAFASRLRPRSLHLGPRSHSHSGRLPTSPPSYTFSCSITSVSRRCRLQEYARHFHMRSLSALPAHQDDSALSTIAPEDT